MNQVSGKEGLVNVLKYFVSPLTREINDDGSPQEVKTLAQEVSELIKGNIIFRTFSVSNFFYDFICLDEYFDWYAGLVGTEAYSEAVLSANRILAVRRRERQAVRKAESVTQPEKIAQLRIKKHFAKRVAKKVKIARLKGVKPKLKNLAMKRK